MAIKQPKNIRLTAEQKATKAEIKLVWKSTFGKESTERFTTVQKYVDSECIRRMVPYTPMRTGILAKAAVLGTKIGSGEIHYTVPYARYQYYGKVFGPNIPIVKQGLLVGFYSPPKKYPTGKDLVYNKAKHPLAQRLWFETMKHNHKEQILRGAAAIARRK